MRQQQPLVDVFDETCMSNCAPWRMYQGTFGGGWVSYGTRSPMRCTSCAHANSKDQV